MNSRGSTVRGANTGQGTTYNPEGDIDTDPGQYGWDDPFGELQTEFPGQNCPTETVWNPETQQCEGGGNMDPGGCEPQYNVLGQCIACCDDDTGDDPNVGDCPEGQTWVWNPVGGGGCVEEGGDPWDDPCALMPWLAQCQDDEFDVDPCLIMPWLPQCG